MFRCDIAGNHFLSQALKKLSKLKLVLFRISATPTPEEPICDVNNVVYDIDDSPPDVTSQRLFHHTVNNLLKMIINEINTL